MDYVCEALLIADNRPEPERSLVRVEHVGARPCGQAPTVSFPEAGPQELASWINAIGEIMHGVNRSIPFGHMLDLIASTTARLAGCDYCAVMLAAPDRESLRIEGSYGLSPDYVSAINEHSPILIRAGALGSGPASQSFRSQRPVALPDVRADPMSLRYEPAVAAQGIHSILSVPLIHHGAPLGLLVCYTAQRRLFSSNDVLLIEAIANQAAVALEAALQRDSQCQLVDDLATQNAELKDRRAQSDLADALQGDLIRAHLNGADLASVAGMVAISLTCEIVVEDQTGLVLTTAPEQSSAPASPPTGDGIRKLTEKASDGRSTIVFTVPVSPDSDGSWLFVPIFLEGARQDDSGPTARTSISIHPNSTCSSAAQWFWRCRCSAGGRLTTSSGVGPEAFSTTC